MSPALDQLHDAKLLTIRFDWATRTCNFDFMSPPQRLDPFTMMFVDVTEAYGPGELAIGRSVSVSEAKDCGLEPVQNLPVKPVERPSGRWFVPGRAAA